MPKERPLGETLLARTEYRFGLVLLLLLATFVVLMVGSSARWLRPATVALTGTTLLAALFAAGVSLRLRRLAVFVVAIAIVVAIVAAAIDESAGDSAAALLNAGLVAVAP